MMVRIWACRCRRDKERLMRVATTAHPSLVFHSSFAHPSSRSGGFLANRQHRLVPELLCRLVPLFTVLVINQSIENDSKRRARVGADCDTRKWNCD
jgi:hypothetical protein